MIVGDWGGFSEPLAQHGVGCCTTINTDIHTYTDSDMRPSHTRAPNQSDRNPHPNVPRCAAPSDNQHHLTLQPFDAALSLVSIASPPGPERPGRDGLRNVTPTRYSHSHSRAWSRMVYATSRQTPGHAGAPWQATTRSDLMEGRFGDQVLP